MENKCNKTPNNNNNKYMDHVYCHPSESKNYIRASNAGAGGAASAAGSDFLALLKENKQLRAMLILHLDLIQAQSDQLQAKDKQLGTQSAELETLRATNTQLETQVQELQKQLQRQIKRTTLSPPPLAKIQRKTEPIVTGAVSPAPPTTLSAPNIIGERNGKLISKIILHRVNLPERSPNSTTTTSSDTTSEAGESSASKTQRYIEEEDEEEQGDDDDDDIETCEITGNTTEDSSDVLANLKQLKQDVTPPLIVSRGAKPLHQPSGTTVTTTGAATKITQPISICTSLTAAPTVQVCVTPPTPSRGKQMPLMLWHAPDIQSDESASCDSDQRSTAASPASSKMGNDLKKPRTSYTSSLRSSTNMHNLRRVNKSRRCGYITTPQMYCTREWEDEEAVCGFEFIKEEAEALHVDAPMLEIPKWTEHELTVSYCIEGTENLSDEAFLKRHEKLELTEKRRKKWDVQQIREQRRIEQLKRRHCKDEIQVPPEQQTLLSFYPQPDSIQTICFSNDLPVQAFGEVLPKISTNSEFALPWLETAVTVRTSTTLNSNNAVVTLAQAHTANTSTQAQQQLLNSTFVFVKKRKRQQSSSAIVTTTPRQRTAAAKATTTAVAAATATAMANTIVASTNPNEIPK